MEEHYLVEGELYKNLITIIMTDHEDLKVARSSYIVSPNETLLCIKHNINKTKFASSLGSHYSGSAVFLYKKIVGRYFFVGPHPKLIFERLVL